MEQAYVIMLDYLLEVYSHHWPISKTSDSLEGCRQESQHDGAPAIEPRNACQMIFLENKSLINATNGGINNGGIYEMRRLPE